MNEPSLFAPRNLADVEQRLQVIRHSECRCDVGRHEDALHDLAADDVPWLIAEVRRLQGGES